MNQPIALQWKKAVEFIEEMKFNISKKYLIIAGVIAVEPHKNTTNKSKTGTNTKAGTSHFHMVVSIAHSFFWGSGWGTRA